MATKGGSLLGKADSTLAQMSYREAMADVAPDLKSVYQEEMLTQAMFEKGVQDHFDTLYADNNALSKELEDATAKAMTGLGTDYQAMELFDNELSSMKQRMKALPKDKKGNFERAKIRAEMSELLKSSADLDATITKIGTMIDNKEYNKNATGSKNLSLLTSIANGTAKKNIKNGKLFYSMDYNGETVEMDRDAVESALVQNDPTFQASFEKISPMYNNKGKQKGAKWEDSRQAAINDYADSFTSEAAYAANINERQGGLGYTFVEALMGKDGSDSIYKALMNMGPATIEKYDVAGGADGKSDGKITEADFANPENGITLINSLTDIHDKENFDFETAKLVAGEFYADKLAGKEFEDGTKMRPKSGTAETSDTDKPLFNPNMYYPLGILGGSVTGGQINGWVDSIKAGREFDFEGNSYSHIDGGWYLNYNDGSEEGKEKSTTNSDNYIGSADNLIFSAFGDGGSDSRFKNITTEKIKIIDHKTGVEIEDSTDSVENKGLHTKIFDQIATAGINDDTAAEKLNTLFDLNKATSKIQFMPFTNRSEFELRKGVGGTRGLKADAPGTDDIMLFNPRTGEVVKDENKNRIKFKTGQEITSLNEKGLSPEISQIIKILKEQNIKIPGSETDQTAGVGSKYPVEKQ